MTKIIVVAFRAIAYNKFGHPYDASFLFHFPENTVTADQVNSMVIQVTNQFYNMHPSGQITEQFQRIGYMKP